MMQSSTNIEFIMVRPVYLGNIGAMARLMKNFGFTKLTLVDPPKQYKDAEARKMAVGAFDILKAARVCATLDQALDDIQIAYGTTCAKQRAQSEISDLCDLSDSVWQVADGGNRVAFVFGEERNGLTNAELNLCHKLVRIPTSQDFPSMNLAQAAAVVAYELTRSHPLGFTIKTDSEPAEYPTGTEEKEFIQQLGDFLDQIEFSRTYNRPVVLAELQALYKRMTPTRREISLLKGILHKLAVPKSI